MSKTIYKNTASRIICIVLTAIILSSFPTGASAFAFCMDAEKNHFVAQKHLHLADCHTLLETSRTFTDEPYCSLANQNSKDCIDISLSSISPLLRPSELFLSEYAPPVFSVLVSGSHLKSREIAGQQISSALIRPHLPSLSIIAQRTVVLLI